MKRLIKSSSLMTKWHAIIAAAEDPRLSGLALRVYIRLVDHFNLKRGQCNPSIHRLAKALQVTPRGVQKALRCLEGLELIITDCGGGCHRSNRYHIPAIQTPNSRVTNPERAMPKTTNPSSDETLKETIKKSAHEDEAARNAVRNAQLQAMKAEKTKTEQLGKIENDLAKKLGENGWFILNENDALTSRLRNQIYAGALSYEAARKVLLESAVIVPDK
jgi:DNA-binding transcriptional regulator YhcF (GntR family)